jgi:hypothetical protein
MASPCPEKIFLSWPPLKTFLAVGPPEKTFLPTDSAGEIIFYFLTSDFLVSECFTVFKDLLKYF